LKMTFAFVLSRFLLFLCALLALPPALLWNPLPSCLMYWNIVTVFVMHIVSRIKMKCGFGGYVTGIYNSIVLVVSLNFKCIMVFLV
jgi:hypothetical protein